MGNRLNISSRQMLLSIPNQFLRDLMWIFTTPAIIRNTDFSFDATPIDQLWFEYQQKNPQWIEQHMQAKNLKMLGPYFEALWEYYLLNHPGKKLIRKNLQVYDEASTQGEFDFIYLNTQTNEYNHLEVAIKYYLGVSETQQNSHLNDNRQPSNSRSLMRNWVGPGVNDRLDKKFHKLLVQQSCLSKKPYGQRALIDLGISKVTAEICLLGYLFYPYEQEMASPEMSYSHHNRGVWVRFSELARLVEQQPYWGILSKPHWLAPLIKSQDQLLDPAQIINKITQHFTYNSGEKTSFRPLLICSFEKFNSVDHHQYASGQLVFVVPDNWPNQN